MYHRNIFGSSSKVFGNLRKSSDIFGNFRKFKENVRERSSGLRNNFEKSSEIFGNLRKIVKYAVISKLSLYNKQNNTWTLRDMEFIFSCSHSISHSFTALTRSISMWTLEDKFHISARPCIILYLFPVLKQAQQSASVPNLDNAASIKQSKKLRNLLKLNSIKAKLKQTATVANYRPETHTTRRYT